jgi:drug/metabolite transporter (DMT)-like permease
MTLRNHPVNQGEIVSTPLGRDQFRLGLLFATGSALTFGFSGPLAKSLMTAGWSPTAAVTARLALGALVLAAFATIIKPDWLREARAHARTVVAYGMIPVAGAQLCFYSAVAHLPVAVALLVEYTAPILVVGWVWATTKQAPSRRTLVGAAMAIAGVTLVLDVFSPVTPGTHISLVGVAWALGAAVCAACYFVMSDEVTADGSGLNAITLAAGSLIVAAVTIALLGTSGLLSLQFTTNNAILGGSSVPWLVPTVLMAVVATAIAYTLGISGVARLRPSFASLMGLAEVLFAVLVAWLLLGEAISPIQAIGGAVVLLGLALARPASRGSVGESSHGASATIPV